MGEYMNDQYDVAQYRVARPTNDIGEIKRFYKQGLGLKEIGSFNDHKGFNGVMFGLPGNEHHLEFTQNDQITTCSPPSKDNLLVFYFPEIQDRDSIVKRLVDLGYKSVEPENPYWKQKGITIEDPDGWRVVLMNSEGI